jgi:hypothetical protein
MLSGDVRCTALLLLLLVERCYGWPEEMVLASPIISSSLPLAAKISSSPPLVALMLRMESF